MVRFLTAGEAHGPALIAVVEGLPAGVPVTRKEIGAELSRHAGGVEHDAFEILSGVRHGVSTGTPVSVMIGNPGYRDEWVDEMSPDPRPARRPLTVPRPGSGDLSGMLKYGASDARPVVERLATRADAAAVVAGCLARTVLSHVDIELSSRVVRIGGTDIGDDVDIHSVLAAELAAAAATGDSVGGAFTVTVHGLPSGLGSYVHWDRALDGRLAQAVMSIDGVAAVEVGDGLARSREWGSVAHDALVWEEDKGYRRTSNRSGGLEGGMTTGEALVLGAAVVPPPPPGRPLRTVDVRTKEERVEPAGGDGVCPVPAVAVVAEARVGLVLVGEVVAKSGGDSLDDVRQNVTAYRRMLRWS